MVKPWPDRFRQPCSGLHFHDIFASFAFMVDKVNSSSGRWACLVVHVKAIVYTLPESEVLGSFDKYLQKIKIKYLFIKYDLFVTSALFTIHRDLRL